MFICIVTFIRIVIVICKYICTYTIYIYIYTYMYMYMYVCIYIYICMCIYLFIHLSVYSFMYLGQSEHPVFCLVGPIPSEETRVPT